MGKDNRQAINNLPSFEINRNSYEPAYMQLVYILKQQVASGLLRVGDRLPSESQICKQYKVSPMTVRRAINILSDQGIVDTAQGRGTFVRPIKLESATFQLSALQDIFTSTQVAVTILEARILSADERVSQKLKLQDEKRVIYIRRSISLAGEPLLYHREYLIYNPRRALIESELEVTSLRGLFQGESGGDLKYGELSIETTSINEEEALLLKSPAGMAAFNLEHIFYDYSDQPVSWGWFICRGDRLRFTTTLGICEEEL
ncbi:MAG: GntR family transcriptional regulator [Bacillota bacterium]